MALPDTSSFPQSGSIVSRWKLDESSGTRYDSVGSNDLTDNNSVGSGTGPYGDTCADLESTSTHFLNKSDNASLSITGDMSYFEWINFESWPERFSTFAGKYNVTGNQRSWLFQFDDTNNELWLYISSDGGSTNQSTAKTSWSPSTGTWYHVGFVYDASAGEVQFHVDGSTQGSVVTGNETSIYDGTANFEMGGWLSGANPFDGLKQDGLLYNLELTNTEAGNVYSAYSDSGISEMSLNRTPIRGVGRGIMRP